MDIWVGEDAAEPWLVVMYERLVAVVTSSRLQTREHDKCGALQLRASHFRPNLTLQPSLLTFHSLHHDHSPTIRFRMGDWSLQLFCCGLDLDFIQCSTRIVDFRLWKHETAKHRCEMTILPLVLSVNSKPRLLDALYYDM